MQLSAAIPAMTAAENLPAFAAGWAFFLDIDGTLAGFARAPDAVTIRPTVIDVLGRLVRATGGAVALITGRAIADVDELFAPLKLPVAGQHGIERRNGEGQIACHADVARKLDSARAALTELAKQYTGLVFEDKGETLALHYRGQPSARGAAQWIVKRELKALGPEFTLQRGKMVFEIRPSGRDKGTAIAEFMREPPFARLTPVFIGDDKTDEDGFEIVNRLDGHSVKVGNGPTAARFWLTDAEAVPAWLDGYVAFLDRGAT
jgi:trehalose 6-phosphate phosphatase